jgi:putative ABC transport system substrate-binding protein
VHRANGFQPPVKLLSQRIQYPPWAWGADMRRRDFIKVIGSTVAWPLAARAQAPGRGQQKVPTIGFLGGGTAASIWSSWAAAFVKRLAELGWVEHRTIAIEYRWAEGRSDRFAEIAAEFVRLKVDVIVTGGIAVPALMQATSVIPVVIALGSDPVGSGQVASLARPGGNVTGLSLQYTELAGKRLELLREIMPELRHLAVIANAGYADALLESRAIEKLAGTLGIDVTAPEIRRAQDIPLAFEAFKGVRRPCTSLATRS